MEHIRLFRNEWLERLTQISFSGFVAIWCMVLSLMVWTNWGIVDVVPAVLLVVAGFLTWLPFEYAMHRGLFHWESQSPMIRKLVFLMHENHHASPNDRMRNLMPPVVSLPIAAAIWLGSVALLGPAAAWAALGFVIGYVVYDIAHYACHQWPMKSRFGMMFKRHHMRHHHVTPHGNFAITALFLDRMLRTRIASAQARREVQKTP